MTTGRLQQVGAVAAIAAAIGVWALLAVIGATSYAGWRSITARAPDAGQTTRLRGSVLGRREAPVAIVEFSDFECPSCAAYALRVFPDVRTRYVDTGQVLYAQKHLILERRHPLARGAAIAAECAARQSVMWPYREKVFASSPVLDRTTLLALGANIVTDAQRFEECVDAADGRAVEADLADAGRLRIGATPTFVIGPVDKAGIITIQKTVVGASGADLYAAIDAVLEGIAK
jgi:protein-disulfide isomerase